MYGSTRVHWAAGGGGSAAASADLLATDNQYLQALDAAAHQALA